MYIKIKTKILMKEVTSHFLFKSSFLSFFLQKKKDYIINREPHFKSDDFKSNFIIIPNYDYCLNMGQSSSGNSESEI